MKTCITKGIVTVSLTAILLSCSSTWAAGKGGVGLAATRLVYSEGEEQISLGVRNTSPDVPYLIQSWVMTPDNKKSADFIITPPLFVLNPANENLLRIMYIGPPLAKRQRNSFLHQRTGSPFNNEAGRRQYPEDCHTKRHQTFLATKRFSISLSRGSGETALHFVS